jgi:hypothetical protein
MEDSRIGNAILSDLGVFATMNLGSGLPYTRLINVGNGQTGPPTRAGQGAQTAEQLNASRTPMEKQFDLRVTKGFQVLGRGAQLFVDARNPLGSRTHRRSTWRRARQRTKRMSRARCAARS